MSTNPEVFRALQRLRKGHGITHRKVRRSDVLLSLGESADAVYAAICEAVEKIELEEVRDAVRVAYALRGDSDGDLTARRNAAFKVAYIRRSQHIEREDDGFEEMTHLLTGDDSPARDKNSADDAAKPGPLDQLKLEGLTILTPDEFAGSSGAGSDAVTRLVEVVEKVIAAVGRQDKQIAALGSEAIAQGRDAGRLMELVLDLNQVVTVQNEQTFGLLRLLSDKGVATFDELAAYAVPQSVLAELTEQAEEWANLDTD